MHSQDDARLDAALDELKQDAAEPPAQMRPAIMDTVRREPAGTGARRADGGTMTRKMMIGLAAAAAFVMAVLMVTGFPPDLGGVQGTVGQAKRYTAPQMAAGDAAVGDPAVQQFIQSETFAALLKDREAMKLLADPQLRVLLSEQGLAAE
jgi:hypothetical protein